MMPSMSTAKLRLKEKDNFIFIIFERTDLSDFVI